MINRNEFVNLLESSRLEMLTTMTSLMLLTPSACYVYEECQNQDALYKETLKGLQKKTNSELLKEAISLGITE